MEKLKFTLVSQIEGSLVMRFIIESQTQINGAPELPSAMFPGAVELADGSLFMLFVAGSSFESSNQRVMKARSIDRGRSWQVEGFLYDQSRLGMKFPFSDCCKPTRISSNELIAVGYGFERDRPEMGLSDYAEKFGCFPRARNTVLHSYDNGVSWTDPEFMAHSHPALELSGPALRLPDGRLMVFAAPFTLHAGKQTGLCMASSDGGKNWEEHSAFFESNDVAPWEVRSCRLPSGRIMLVIWGFDLKRQRHLNNLLVYSDDDGRSWSKAIDTGLRGQAANFFARGDMLAILQARREGDAPGIYLNQVRMEGDSVVILDETMLWAADGKSNSDGRIEEQFKNLKFGQPSLLNLGSNESLLVFWHFQDGKYSVQANLLHLE